MSANACPRHAEAPATACCPRCGDFFCASCQADRADALCVRCASRQRAPVRLPQGLRLLLGGLGVYGALSSLFNIFLVAMGLTSIYSIVSGEAQLQQGEVQVTLGLGLTGLLGLSSGMLFIVSARWLSQRERRQGAQVALGVGALLGLSTGVCGVVGLGLLVWALIYLNLGSTKQLFQS